MMYKLYDLTNNSNFPYYVYYNIRNVSVHRDFGLCPTLGFPWITYLPTQLQNLYVESDFTLFHSCIRLYGC